MRYAPMKGWAVLARTSRVEWPVPFTFRQLRREAKDAFWKEMQASGVPHDLIRQRWLDGEYRLAKVTINLAEEPTDD